MNHLVIVNKHPLSEITEASCNLEDYLDSFKKCNNMIVKVSEWLEDPCKDFWNRYPEIKLITLCLDDSISLQVLNMLTKQLEHVSKVKILFQPTMRYIPATEITKSLIENIGTWHLFTNNISFLPKELHDSKFVINSNCVKELFLKAKESSEVPFVLVVADLLENVELLYTETARLEVIPFLQGIRSRKMEKLAPMTLLSTLGMSSLQASPEVLRSNLFDVGGICFDTNRPEFIIPGCKELIYPSIKSKAFGRWAYIANQLNKEVKSDHMHGYQMYSGVALEKAIENFCEDWLS